MRNSSFWLVVVAALSALWPKAVLGEEPLSKGVEFFQKHNYKAAADAFQPLTKTSRGATATYYLGLSLIQLGFNPEAEVQFRRVVAQWPGSAEAKLAAAYLDHVSQADPARAPKLPQIDPVRKAEWEALPVKCRIPIQRENGHLWVTAIINGKPCKMIFDTGAATCCLSSVDYPHVFSARQLAQAREGKGARVYGLVPMKFLSTEVTLQDITRKLEIGVIQEPGCSLIGQNFLNDYSYEVDDFYLRLTKTSFEADKLNADSAGVAAASALAVSKAAAAPVMAAAGKIDSGPASRASGSFSDKFTVPYTTENSTMFVPVLLNRKPVRAEFDTGCAPDGIVINASKRREYGVDPKTDLLERFEMGPVILLGVKVYYADGIKEPLIGPKLFNRPYIVDPARKIIKFQY